MHPSALSGCRQERESTCTHFVILPASHSRLSAWDLLTIHSPGRSHHLKTVQWSQEKQSCRQHVGRDAHHCLRWRLRINPWAAVRLRGAARKARSRRTEPGGGRCSTVCAVSDGDLVSMQRRWGFSQPASECKESPATKASRLNWASS